MSRLEGPGGGTPPLLPRTYSGGSGVEVGHLLEFVQNSRFLRVGPARYLD